MHFTSLLALSLAGTSCHAYLYSEHAAAQRPSWRSLISRGPSSAARIGPGDDALVQCGNEAMPHFQVQGQSTGVRPRRNTVLNKTDLAIAQNKLMRFCASGGSIPPMKPQSKSQSQSSARTKTRRDTTTPITNSMQTASHTETSNGVAVQICNRSPHLITCDRAEIKALFEAIACGSLDAPQMGFAAPAQCTGRLSDAEWILALGPVDELAECAPLPLSERAYGYAQDVVHSRLL